jgi:hypothetical protein
VVPPFSASRLAFDRAVSAAAFRTPEVPLVLASTSILVVIKRIGSPYAATSTVRISPTKRRRNRRKVAIVGRIERPTGTRPRHRRRVELPMVVPTGKMRNGTWTTTFIVIVKLLLLR